MQKQKIRSFSSWQKLICILCICFSGEAFAGLVSGGGSLGSITDSTTDSTTPSSKFETRVSEHVQLDYSIRDFQTLLVQEVLQPRLANLRTTGLDGGEISVRDTTRRQVVETAWDHRSLEDYFEALCEGLLGEADVRASETTDLRSLCDPIDVQDHIFRLYIDDLDLQASVPEDYATLVFIDDSTLNLYVRLLNVRLRFDLIASVYSVKREKVIAQKTIRLRPNIRELSLQVKVPIRLKETGVLQVGPVDLDELHFDGLSLTFFDELQQVFEGMDGERIYRFLAWTACRDIVQSNSDASGRSLFEKCINTKLSGKIAKALERSLPDFVQSLNTTIATGIQDALGAPFHFQAEKVRYRAQAKTEVFNLSQPRLILGFQGDIKARGRVDTCAQNWELPSAVRSIELPIAPSTERDALARLVMSDQWMEWMLAVLGKTGRFCEKRTLGTGMSALTLEWFPRSTPVLSHGVLPYTQITVDYVANERLGPAQVTAPQITQMAEIKIEPGVLAAYKIVIPMKLKATHGVSGRQARGKLEFHALFRIETDPSTGSLRAQIGQAFVKDLDLAMDGVDPATLENSLNKQLSNDYSTVLVTTRKPRACPRPADGALALSLDGEMTRSVWRGCSGSDGCYLDLGLKTEVGPRKFYWNDAIYRLEKGYSEHFFDLDDPQDWKLSGCEQTQMTRPQALELVRDSQRAQEIQDQILQSSVLTGMRDLAENQAWLTTFQDQIKGLIESRYGPIVIQQDAESVRNEFVNHPQYQQWRTLIPTRQVQTVRPAVRPAVRPQQNLNRPGMGP